MVRPDWKGQTVICIASGPSLTAEDCEVVRNSGKPTIVTNTTFRACPWADVLFAFDARWWMVYAQEVKQVFKGRLVSASAAVSNHGVETTYGVSWFRHSANSGACAISLAVAGRASKVVMLGFDCQLTDGKTHHHGDHENGLSNCASIRRWPVHFSGIAKHAAAEGVEVVNVSRATALTCFPRSTLEAQL